MIEAPYYNVVDRLAQELERYRRETQRLERLIALGQIKVLLPPVETLLDGANAPEAATVQALIEEARRAVHEGEVENRQHVRARREVAPARSPMPASPTGPTPASGPPAAGGRETVVVYLADDRNQARRAGRALDESFPAHVLTGLNFFVRPDGRVVIVALLAGQVDWDTMTRARLVLGQFAVRHEMPLRRLLDDLERGAFVEQYLGQAALDFCREEAA
jgi:hypothetical protein